MSLPPLFRSNGPSARKNAHTPRRIAAVFRFRLRYSIIMLFTPFTTRKETILLYRFSDQPTVEGLLEFGRRIEQTKEAVARKPKKSSNSSKLRFSDRFVKPPRKRSAQDGETKHKPGA